MFDFSKYELSKIRYGGSERKIGIIINKNNYMIKFQKNTQFGKRFNHISEYLGSKIFSYLGFETQLVYLGLYNKEQVVACKDFVNGNTQFIPFNDIGESSIEEDKEKYQYSYEEIISMLCENQKITNVDETIDFFWEMYIVDALLGNFDRHGGNWGFLKEKNKYKLAPVFDNGSCLFPQMIDESKMIEVITSKKETDLRVFTFPTSQIKLNNKKSSYYEVINSLQFKECNDALKKIYGKISIDEINEIIDNTEFISETHKKFYKHIIKQRYELILKASYEKLKQEENDELLFNNCGNKN